MTPFIVMLVILIPVGIGFFIAYQKAVAEANGKKPAAADMAVAATGDQKSVDVRAKVARAKTAQDYLGFETIMGKVVKLDPNRYRAYIEVEPVSYFLMTAGEQEILEAGFRQVLEGLRFPIQIYIASVPLDVSEQVATIEKGLEQLPSYLQDYGRELAAFTNRWVSQVSPITKRYIVVITYDYEPNARKPVRPEIIEQQALQELDNRCQMVIEAFSRSKVNANRLDEDEILPLLYQMFNRGAGGMAARALTTENYHALYTTRGRMDSDEAVLKELYGDRAEEEVAKSA